MIAGAQFSLCRNTRSSSMPLPSGSRTSNINASARRTLVADTLASHLRCHLLYQTDECRDELIRAAEDSLDLHTFRIPAPVGTWAWKTPDGLRVTAGYMYEHWWDTGTLFLTPPFSRADLFMQGLFLRAEWNY